MDWWSRYSGMLRSVVLINVMSIVLLVFREDSEIEYLKIAQDLDMYGVNYFEITVSAMSCEYAASTLLSLSE